MTDQSNHNNSDIEHSAVRMKTPPADIITPEVLVPESLIDFWRETINGHLSDGIKHLLEAGRDLIKAKAALGHGNFSSLFGPGRLRIDHRTAQLLMRVSKNQTISNANNFSHLPPSLTSLNVLASIDQRDLQRAIETGKVAPHMTISEVKYLVKKCKKRVKPIAPNSAPTSGPSTPSEFGSFDMEGSIKRIQRFLDIEFQKCPDELHSQLLRGVVSHLESFSATHENL